MKIHIPDWFNSVLEHCYVLHTGTVISLSNSYSNLKVDWNIFETNARKVELDRDRAMQCPLLASEGGPVSPECSATEATSHVLIALITDQKGMNGGWCKWDWIQGLMGEKPTAGRTSWIEPGWEKLKLGLVQWSSPSLAFPLAAKPAVGGFGGQMGLSPPRNLLRATAGLQTRLSKVTLVATIKPTTEKSLGSQVGWRGQQCAQGVTEPRLLLHSSFQLVS